MNKIILCAAIVGLAVLPAMAEENSSYVDIAGASVESAPTGGGC